MFSAFIKCECGYEYRINHNDQKMNVWAAEKLAEIHARACLHHYQITFSKADK